MSQSNNNYIEISQSEIDNFPDDPSIEGNIDLIRENSREKIANRLIKLVACLYIIFLLTGGLLVYFLKITFRDMLDLILVLGAITGFMGTAINFYFKE